MVWLKVKDLHHSTFYPRFTRLSRYILHILYYYFCSAWLLTVTGCMPRCGSASLTRSLPLLARFVGWCVRALTLSTFLLFAPWIVAAADPGIIWHLSIWTGWKAGFASYLVPVLSFCVFCQVSKRLVAWNLLTCCFRKCKKKSNRSNYFWRLCLLGYVKFNAVHQGIMHVFKSLILYNQDNSNMLL